MKQQLRKEVLANLQKMTYRTYVNDSHELGHKLLSLPIIMEATTIAVTVSRRPEVDTIAIIEALWQLGKTVVVPKCETPTKTMKFYILEDFAQLETVYMDLREPNPVVCEEITPDIIDIVIVPGVVFSPQGYRIGFGGGYYDRFLAMYPLPTVALAFDCQVRDKVPRDVYDIPIDTLITNTAVVNCVQERDSQ